LRKEIPSGKGMKMFKKILIANRGEIACRVIKTAKKLGIQTVAIYSDVDENALFVQMADEAFALHGVKTQDTYLNIDKIINIAKQSNVEAIHPGYGFLSENVDFAKRLEKEKIIFIGPSSEAIKMMGSKSEAKTLMQKANVPLIPGYHGSEQSPDFLLNEAKKMGFPLLIKATFGGGGKGMRIVHDERTFLENLESCQREALASFGNAEVLLEKYFINPRHVEVQVFADNFGHCIHLFERDCSLQRRHQKIIEEAPAPNLSDSLRQQLGLTAVNAAKSIGYTGAGTIEFLVDNEHFFFMEMNTRLQVEHPVTEMITGLDLVEWQLRIAAHEPLPKMQHEITQQGHAIEVRLYAEDPDKHFQPSTGKIHYLHQPDNILHLRIDTGIQAGDTITPYYDPMLAKVIFHGKTREEAIHLLSCALWQYHLVGVKNNIRYLQALLNHPDFIAAKLSTSFIEQQASTLINENHLEEKILAASLYYLTQHSLPKVSNDIYNPFYRYRDFRLNLPLDKSFLLVDEHHDVHSISAIMRHDNILLSFSDKTYHCHSVCYENHKLSAFINDSKFEITLIVINHTFYIFSYDFSGVLSLDEKALVLDEIQNDVGHLRAPMPGALTLIKTSVGQAVKAGDPLLILEAMKMEHTLYAPFDGKVVSINYEQGMLVQEGDELIVLESM
jgi:3-methylcrotonyl-CoA carboxylase alpha subunit